MTSFRLVTLIAVSLLALSCTPSEESSPGSRGDESVSPGGGGTAGSRNEATAEGEASGPKSGEAEAKGGAVERDAGERAISDGAADMAVAEEAPPTAEALSIPLELLTAFPGEPRPPWDWRIGELPRVEMIGPQESYVLEATGRYLTALLAGEAEESSYYDRFTEAEIEARLQADCSSFRLGVPERLPQGEWSVPYRCLQAGAPTPLGGVFYLSVGDTPRVVDGVAEPLGRDNSGEGPNLETEGPPF